MSELLSIARKRNNEISNLTDKLERLYRIRDNFDNTFDFRIETRSSCGSSSCESKFLGIDKGVFETIKILVKNQLENAVESNENRIKVLVGNDGGIDK